MVNQWRRWHHTNFDQLAGAEKTQGVFDCSSWEIWTTHTVDKPRRELEMALVLKTVILPPLPSLLYLFPSPLPSSSYPLPSLILLLPFTHRERNWKPWQQHVCVSSLHNHLWLIKWARTCILLYTFVHSWICVPTFVHSWICVPTFAHFITSTY